MVLGCVSLTLATICIGVRKFFAGLSACCGWFRGRIYIPRPRIFESKEARKAYKEKLKLRSGHVDMTFLGAFQVDGAGNIASYEVPGKIVAGVGGAMDLLAGAKVVNIVTEHCSKDGATKLLKKCTYPLTGTGEADGIITERAVFRRHPDKGFVLEEVARGYTLEDIAGCTEMDYVVSDTVKLDAYGPEPGD